MRNSTEAQRHRRFSSGRLANSRAGQNDRIPTTGAMIVAQKIEGHPDRADRAVAVVTTFVLDYRGQLIKIVDHYDIATKEHIYKDATRIHSDVPFTAERVKLAIQQGLI